jgi:hypothetical protein
MYYLHQDDQDCSIFAGTSVLSPGRLCLPFESCPNHNLFQNYFGVKFHHDGSTYVCAISTYEFTQCFGLIKQIQYWLSHEQHRFSLNASMPGCMLAWLDLGLLATSSRCTSEVQACQVEATSISGC